MGHTEMLLAVAGLDEKAIRERTRKLAAGDWSGFPPAHRVAFGFAHKQSTDPVAAARDVPALIEHFGPDRALDVIWWACRCHYMTCVSEAFQLPLEKENVFDGFLPAAGGPEPPPGK